jgi:hypothetical protein
MRKLLLTTAAVAAAIAAVGCPKKPPQEYVPETHTAVEIDSNTQTVQNEPEEELSADTAKDADNSGLVNAPREVWVANLGGNVAFHFIAITFLPNHRFIYKDACTDICREVENYEEWKTFTTTKGNWNTDGNNLTMVFSDGHTVTVPYAVDDDELTFDFGETGSDERLGSGVGVCGAFHKQKLY